jgi:hypothetical protein
MAQEQSREQRCHNFHTVHFHQLPVSLRIHALAFRERLLQTPRRHAREEVAVCE